MDGEHVEYNIKFFRNKTTDWDSGKEKKQQQYI